MTNYLQNELTVWVDARVEVLDEGGDAADGEDWECAEEEEDVEDGERDEERRDVRLHRPLAQDRHRDAVGRHAHQRHHRQPHALRGKRVRRQQRGPVLPIEQSR